MATSLNGFKVVDFSLYVAGPEAGALLGDMGADVIKIEQRQIGDPQRGVHTVIGIHQQHSSGLNMGFARMNRNKRGIALDITKPEGKEIIYRLVERSDVFLTNYRRLVLEKLQLTYEILRQHNPRLVYAQATGYGLKGPDSDLPVLDGVGLTRSGMAMSCGEEGAPPAWLVPGMSDIGVGVTLAFAIVSALLARERSGEGQMVTTSQLSSMLELQSWLLTAGLFSGNECPRVNPARSPLWNFYKCADDLWGFLAVVRDNEWPVLCEAIGLPQMASDPRFDSMSKRAENGWELLPILNKTFSTKTFCEWNEIFRRADLIFGQVNTLSDLLRDPQIEANQYIYDYDHPVLGRIKWLGFPFEMLGTPLVMTKDAPELGQHTEEILLEEGYTWSDIENLQDLEVI